MSETKEKWPVVVGVFALMGCASSQAAPPAESAPEETPVYERGVARMYPKSGSKVKGALVFRDSSEGLKITGDLTGLVAGSSYAVSLHTKADCSGVNGKQVGPVYNPDDATPPVGLIGEVRGNEGEEGQEANLVVPHLKLNGTPSVVGLSVVVHAWPHDAEVDWERVPFWACGVIEGD